ncbi:MAG: zinc ribbon domain-containing protein [Oscillospiraceae bacterium]
MKKGKIGIYPWFYAALAFIACMFNQALVVAVIVLFAAAFEKDDWLNRQDFQALGLVLVYNAVKYIWDLAAGFLMLVLKHRESFLTVLSWMTTLIFPAILVSLSALGLFRVLKGSEAQIPGISIIVLKAYGFVAQKPTYAQAQQPQYNQQPQYQHAPNQPSYGVSPSEDYHQTQAEQAAPKPFVQPQYPQTSKPAANATKEADDKDTKDIVCPKCGRVQLPGAAFCHFCGTKIN